MDDSDSLDRILNIAFAEGSLQPDRLHAFATTLRERARLILAERLEALDIRIATLTRETEWQAGIIAGLEHEQAWRTESMKDMETTVNALRRETRHLTETLDHLKKENAWRADSMNGLEEMVASLQRENSWLTETIAALEKQAVGKTDVAAQ
jgi:chromosome segregation ATPase